MTYFRKDFIDFFEELSQNNHKDWFDANKKRYEKEIKAPFLALVEDIIPIIRRVEPHFREEAKKTIFRINRDVRFSKDKSPYKTNVAAAFCARGKNTEYPGFYIHIDAKGCWIGGGCYELSKENLSNIRKEIAYNPERWADAVENKKFTSVYSGLASCEMNKKLPEELKGFEQLPTAILNKRFYFMVSKPAELLLSEQLLPEIQKHIEAGESVYRFLCSAFV